MASRYRSYGKGIKAAQRKARAAARALAAAGADFYTELKFLDCAWNGVTVAASTDGSSGELQPSSGCTGSLSVPSQGDGQSNRDGRNYVIQSVWVSGTVLTAPATDQANATETTGFWFALVLDTQANGSTIVSEDCFINPSTASAAMMPQPLRNLANSKRFRILDRQYCEPNGVYGITDGTATGSLNLQIPPTVSLSWKGNLRVCCTGTTADVASVSDNALHLVGYAGDSTFTPTFTGKSRVRFSG